MVQASLEQVGESRSETVFSWTVLILGLAVLLISDRPGMTENRPFGLIDQTPSKVDVSDGVKEGQGPAELDVKRKVYHFTDDGAYIDFTLDCHPEAQNYITLRIWGDSGSGGQPGSHLLLRHPEKGDGPIDHIPFGHNTSKHPRKGEMVRQHESEPFPDRFYYVTYPIPRSLTRGASTVNLRLKYRGPSPGHELYGVYSHVGAFFQPPPSEQQGKPFELGPPRKGTGVSAKERFKHWQTIANRSIEDAFSYQLFGNKWKKRIQNGEIPEWTWGAIVGNKRFKPHPEYKQAFDEELEIWGGHLMRQAKGNMGAMRHLLTYAKAYLAEWSNHHGDREILHRMVAAMDFYARAQGSNGRFLGPSLSGKDVNWPSWIGGPDREKGHHGLEVGQRYLYQAFRLLAEDIEKTGKLDQKIDHDLNPDTPQVPRRDAYARMMRKSLEQSKNNVFGRSIANQIIHNYFVCYSVNEAIKILRPDKAISEEMMKRLAEIATGIRKHPRWKHYSYSPDGMPLEDGYDGNYGKGGLQLVELAKKTGYENLQKKAHDVFNAYAHFMSLSNGPEGHRVLRNAEWISNRVFIGFPGRIRYFLSRYAAGQLTIPAAIRYYELAEQHGRLRKPQLQERSNISPHHAIAILGAVRRANEALEALRFTEADELPSTSYRLPTERDEDSVFVDEHLGLITVRHGKATMVAMLNWESRKGKQWMDGSANNITRIRYTTPTVDRLVTGKNMNSHSDPMGLNTMRYGRYFMVVNASESERFKYEVPADMQGTVATDLVTGDRGQLQDGTIPPFSSRVFVVESRND